MIDSAAEEAALEMAFLIGEGGDIHWQPGPRQATAAITPSAPSSQPAWF